MNELFLKILNMSIAASWLVLAVLLLRLILKKAPKWVMVLLWGLVAVRLLCPFSIESALSLIPSTETVPLDIEMDWTPAIDSGINAVNSIVNPVISASFTPHSSASANPLQIWIPLASLLWITGMAVMLLYTAISYWRLRRKLRTAVLLRDNLFQSEQVGSPFVLGIIKPRVYLPFRLDGQDLMHVVAHEQAHIRRKDHWWKPLGFLLLTIHWFNPLMWLAYVLLCRDIELACDEKVIKELGNEERANYTQALLTCSIHRRSIAACPLAFGEVGVKERVKSVMNYKKPAFWVILLSIAACVVVAVCFLTNPPSDDYTQKDYIVKYYLTSYLSDTQQTEVNTAYNREQEAISVTVNFESTEGPLKIELLYSHKKNGETEWQYSDPVKLALGESAAFMVPADHHFSFAATSLAGENGNVKLVFHEFAEGQYKGEHKQTLSLNDVIILSQKGYDLTWSDFEQYDYIKTGSGLYIRVYEINELFSLSIGGAGPAREPMYIYLALADDMNTKIDIRDGGVTEFISEHNSVVTEKWDLIPMVMVNGELYLHTGYESTVEGRCGVMDGQITSEVDGSQRPTVNDQSNFGTGFDYQYGSTEGTIEIYMNDSWWIFATEEARRELQFPSTETAFSLNFAGNTSLQHTITLTEDKPYWCIGIANEGSDVIVVELAGDVYKVEPGTSDTIYADEKWKPGTYTVSFASTVPSGMEGSAVCQISSSVFPTEGPSNEHGFNKYYLTIGAEGVTSIELSMPDSSGGCQTTDGSPFKKGERIWLEHLDGYHDLRGLEITAFNADGEILWSASIPDGEENEGFTRLKNDDWEITNLA